MGSTRDSDAIYALDFGLYSSADSKLTASVGLGGKYDGHFNVVQITTDGMGLDSFFRLTSKSAYSIYDHLVY